MVKGSGLTAFFSPSEARFRVGQASVRLEFPGASPDTQVEGLHTLAGHANFLVGSAEEWRRDVPMYGGIAYRNLYPGIDLVYGYARRNLKSEFIVAPGADPSQIRLLYSGAGELRIDDTGALVIPVGDEEVREHAPVLYQMVDGRRVAVEGRFALLGEGAVSFVVGRYEVGRALIIDPVVSYSTLLGGSSSNSAMAVAADASNSAYVAGYTASYDFPTANPEQNFNAGGNDIFVAKLLPSGNGFAYCTYIGGRGDDRALAIAVDAAGSAYLTGFTNSTNFPLANALQNQLKGAKNAFVLKLNPAGNTLVYSTYLGGSGSDTANGIAVDASGNAYLTGDTTSVNFPATAFQKSNHGAQDAFVSKISADGSHLVYSTYLGGSSDDHGAAIAVNNSGTAYVTGSTYSTNFPVANAWQGTIGGGQDAFVAKLSADGNTLLFGTFLGGSGGSLGYPESGQGIALDSQANVYVAGTASSANFPVLNAMQTSLKGWSDVFVAKLTSTGSPVYSTFLGGTGGDYGNAIAVDANGNAYIVGETFSSDLAVVGAVQATYGGDYDAFVAELGPSGTLLMLSYLGGSGSDTATAVALDPAANVYIAGWTQSSNFPVLNGYQSVNAGNYDGFLTKLVNGAPPAIVGVSPNSGSGAGQIFTFQVSDTAGGYDVSSVSILFGSSTSTANACSVTFNQAGNTLMLLTNAGTPPSGTITPGSGSQQNSQCTLNGGASSVSLAGSVLSLNLSITFTSGFLGARNTYMQATNPFGSTSGWQQVGTWTVVTGPPAPVSVTPGSGSGASQTFSFVFTDPYGYSALSTVSIVVNATLSGNASCYMLYYQSVNSLYLANNTGTGWTGPVFPGPGGGTLQNNQCTVNSAASSVSGSGANLTLNLAMSFQGSTGNRNIYMDAYDGTDSGWSQKGTWTVSYGSPSPVSVTPGSGSGLSQTFGFVFSDPRGYTAISTAAVVVNSVLSGNASCYLLYYQSSNTLYLANNTGSAWLGPVSPGQSGTLQNSQCTVTAASSSASGSGTNLTLNLALTFQAAFAGSKNIYMDVYDGLDSGWSQKGTWTVTAGPPAPVSVTPNSGSGGTQAFGFVYTDPRGYAAMSPVSVVINGALSGNAACYILYYQSSNTLYLANDNATAWLGPVTLGQSTTVQNSQCTVNAGTSSRSGSGNNLTLTLALTFPHAFAGMKNIYMEAYDGQDSGWVQMGSWTVP